MLQRATAVYFGIVFVVAFGLGVLRVLVFAPALGQLSAVGIEILVLLVLFWGVAGWALRRRPLPFRGRLAMGGMAFALLMAAEAGLAMLFGQTFAMFLTAMTTPAGLLGLSGQIGFAIIPALRGQLTG